MDAVKFWENVDVTDGCWSWTGGLTEGYGSLRYEGVSIRAHQVAYLLQHGALPPVLDHACHNADTNCPGGPTCQHRRCVNPSHLVPSSIGANTRASILTLASQELARTRCPQGHPYDEVNTYRWHGRRYCRTCGRKRALARYHRTR